MEQRVYGKILFVSALILNIFASLVLLYDRGNLKAQIAEMQEIRQLQEPESAIGGTEIRVEEKSEHYGFAFPVHRKDYVYTSPHGERISPILKVVLHHEGLDLAPKEHLKIKGVWNAQVVSSLPGRVKETWPVPGTERYSAGRFVGYYRGHPALGGAVVIEHENGFETIYGHLSWIKPKIRKGAEVEAGEIIGRVGKTGRTTGEHLHFEILKDGESVNPLLYLIAISDDS